MAEAREYHAHVYYRDPQERSRAARLREKVFREFEVELGRWRDEPVGPHPAAMYQIKFAPDIFGTLVPWLSFHHDGLAILIHPETGEHVSDHTERALWLGDQLGVRTEVFEGMAAPRS